MGPSTEAIQSLLNLLLSTFKPCNLLVNFTSRLLSVEHPWKYTHVWLGIGARAFTLGKTLKQRITVASQLSMCYLFQIFATAIGISLCRHGPPTGNSGVSAKTD
jgi:hypothetical protein